MKKPFSCIQHTHRGYGECGTCHLHYCNTNCGNSFLCSSPECGALAGARLGVRKEDCFLCKGHYRLCGEEHGYYHDVFAKCPQCNVEEMKPFWKDSWIPSKVRMCKCNRCGG